MNTVKSIGTYNLGEEFLGHVIHNGHVVGVPAYRTGYVEHKFGNEGENTGYLVGGNLGRMIVTCVDGQNLVVLGGVGSVEIVRTHGEALQTDTEHLSFDAVLHMLLVLGEDLIEALLQGLTIEHMIDRYILASVVYPYVHNTRIVLSLTHRVCNIAAALGVLYPELTDALVGICQREVSALGVRE